MIKVISFDIGGTLLDSPKDSSNYNLEQLALIVNAPYEIVRSAYKQVFQKTNADLHTLIDMFCKIINVEKSEQLIEFFIRKFSSSNQESIIDLHKLDVIKKLKNMGYKIILLSNTSAVDNHNLPNELVILIDQVFYSYEIGYNKNEDECYRIVEQRMGYKSNEFLHIGDTLSSDYYMPIKNGWKALYYGKTKYENVNTINSFDDILSLREWGNLDDKGRNF